MKKYKDALFQYNSSKMCNLYALHDMLWLNNIHLNESEILLLNLKSFFNVVNFSCDSKEFVAMTICGYQTEIDCLSLLGINYKQVDYLELNKSVNNGKPILIYMYRETGTREKPYYIGPVHSAIILRKNNQLFISDSRGVSVLEKKDIYIIDKARETRLYPYSPKRLAYVINTQNKYIMNKAVIDKLVKQQLHYIVYCYNNNTFKRYEDTIYSMGKMAYESLKEKILNIGILENNNSNNQYFLMQMYMLKKAFIENKSFFRDEIISAFYNYNDKNGKYIYRKIAEKIQNSIPLFNRLYYKIGEAKNRILDKELYTKEIVQIIDDILSMDIEIVKEIKSIC